MEHGEFSGPPNGEPSNEYPLNYGDPALRGTNHKGDLFANVDYDPNEASEPIDDSVATPLDTQEAQSVRIRNELSDLSGRFGPLHAEILEGHLISNDKGMSEICEDLSADGDRQPEGMGLVIGSGPISLLPEFKTEVTVVVDKNTEVVEMSKALNDLIIESDQPWEVLDKIDSPETMERYPVLARCNESPGTIAFIKNKIDQEARSFTNENRNYHWTNPDRFPEVKQALIDRPPVWVAADLTNRQFVEALADIAGQNDLKITHANFTNVHEWIVQRKGPILQKLPIDRRAKIVYSEFVGVDATDVLHHRNILHSRFTQGLPSYLYKIKDYLN